MANLVGRNWQFATSTSLGSGVGCTAHIIAYSASHCPHWCRGELAALRSLAMSTTPTTPIHRAWFPAST